MFGLAKPITEPAEDQTPPPVTVTRSDVTAVRALTAELRALGRAGNGGMPDVLTLTAVDKERLLQIDADSDQTAITLRSALAELHTLAGWCAHDMNAALHVSSARACSLMGR